jgi:AbrB family looped-hinge helix DNA binding protein
MAITRIGPKHQITIPQETFEQLGLEPGDFLEVLVRDDVLYLVPQKLIPREQAWFWAREWQEREREADAVIANEELSGPFKTVDELIQHLRDTE